MGKKLTDEEKALRAKLKAKERVRLTDYIRDLYIANGYEYRKYFPMMMKQLKNYKTEYQIDDKWAYFTLKYMVEIAGMNLFQAEYYNGSILNLLPYYTEVAKEYYQLAHDIKEYAKTFEETNEYQVVKVHPKETRKKLNLTFD